jgi:hypothetical protein
LVEICQPALVDRTVGLAGGKNTNWSDSMKPVTALIIVGLVVALSVVGYLYYQRTSNDITIQLPKVLLTK